MVYNNRVSLTIKGAAVSFYEQFPIHSQEKDKVLSTIRLCRQYLPNPTPDAANLHLKNKYTKIDAIYDHIVPLLYEHGLVVYHSEQPFSEILSVITTTVEHEQSGQWIRAYRMIKNEHTSSKNNNHDWAGDKTYTKRNHLFDLLALHNGEDVDGNKHDKNGNQINPRSGEVEIITQTQYDTLQQASRDLGNREERIDKLCSRLSIKNLGQLSPDRFQETLDWFEKLKEKDARTITEQDRADTSGNTAI